MLSPVCSGQICLGDGEAAPRRCAWSVLFNTGVAQDAAMLSAITPTVKYEDNIQALALQGHAGVIDTCAVCHTQTPDAAFDHRLDD